MCASQGLKSRHNRDEPRAAHAVSGGRLFDGQRVLEDHAVLVEDGVVLGVVPSCAVPAGTVQHDYPGCTLLPGLIDTHVHFMRWQGPQFLAYGVTTVRDAGNDLAWILDRRGEWKGKAWPRILCLGPLLDGPAPFHEHVSRRCADRADAVAAVRETAAAGVDGLKLYVGLDPEWLPAMAAEGHAAGRKLSMHCAGAGVLRAAEAGVDEFFHLDGILADVWPDRPAGWLELWGTPEFACTRERQHEVADHLATTGITATPTLAYWDSQSRIRAVGAAEAACRTGIPPAIVKWQSAPADPACGERWRRALHAAQGFIGLLVERNVPVLAGTDVPCGALPPGLSLWTELTLLVGAGMTPQEAFRAATSAAAEFLGRPELGRLSPGAAADMVVVRGNPLQRIPATPDIVTVVLDGVFHRPADLVSPKGEADPIPEDEPWAIQFEHYWASRAGPQET